MRRLSLIVGKGWFAAAGASFALAADQALKVWCDTHLRLYQHVSLFPGLAVTRNPNRGLAHGFYSNVPNGYIDLYVRYIPSAVLLCLMGFTLWRWREANRTERLGWSLSLAGGASNLWNHWTSESVLDTLAVPTGLNSSLVFNVADVALCVGAGLVLLSLLKKPTP